VHDRAAAKNVVRSNDHCSKIKEDIPMQSMVFYIVSSYIVKNITCFLVGYFQISKR